MKIDITQLSEEELVALNRQIVERLRSYFAVDFLIQTTHATPSLAR
jgi:hypothetical protein